MKTTIAKTVITISLLFAASSSFAVNSFCKGDSMKFEGDKQVHLTYSIGLGAASRAVIKDPWIAFAVSATPGLLREMYNTNSCFSKQDMVYNLVGNAIGVYSAHWVLTPNKVIYSTEF